MCDGREADLYEAQARKSLYVGPGLFQDLFLGALSLHQLWFWMVLTFPFITETKLKLPLPRKCFSHCHFAQKTNKLWNPRWILFLKAPPVLQNNKSSNCLDSRQTPVTFQTQNSPVAFCSASETHTTEYHHLSALVIVIYWISPRGGKIPPQCFYVTSACCITWGVTIKYDVWHSPSEVDCVRVGHTNSSLAAIDVIRRLAPEGEELCSPPTSVQPGSSF